MSASPSSESPEAASEKTPVVGVGASAGGLEALERLLPRLPTESGAAFVVVMHLDPHHESMLVELLGRRTSMKVCVAEHEAAIRPDHVYVIPPNAYLTLEEGRLQLSPLARTHGTRLAVDHFLTSLARDRGPRAVGIVLSGTGSDGTMGIRAIKAQGGVAMVQAPADAQYDGMPRSAIATELVDYVMPVAEMGEPLRHYLAHPYVKRAESAAVEVDDDLELLIEHLHEELGHDFSAYARPVLHQRVLRRMSLRQLSSLREYFGVVEKDADERDRLFRDLLVGVTSFFRDPECFEHLRDEVLVPLARSKPAGEVLRIWVPACASGEEAYSLAMLALDAVSASGVHRPVQVFASDVDERALQIARVATYPDAGFVHVPERLRERYLVTEGDQRRIVLAVREAVLFARHDVLVDPPFSKLDLVSCRNLIGFLEPSARVRLLGRLHFALLPRGYLFVGDEESAEAAPELFVTSPRTPWLARRTDVERREALDLLSLGTRRPARAVTSAPPPRPSAKEVMQAGLLESFSPPAVLVNRDAEVLYFHGELDPFLTIPSGSPTASVFDRARTGIRGSLRAAFQEALRTGAPVATEPRRFDGDDGPTQVSIRVQPLGMTPIDEALLVVFERSSVSDSSPADRDRLTSADRVSELELELAAVRAELEGTIAAVSMTNEELKTSNEEISSMNEELQTSNEELMTSKEELQSLNEELITVNSQLQSKVRELEEANDDLQNLLESTDVATVFLDRNLGIRMFTPSATRHFRLVVQDVGRPLEDIVVRFADPDLAAAAAQVQRTRQPQQQEVLGEDGRWYARRILPYRSSRQDARGVLLTLTDIDLLKRSEVEVREARDDLEARIEARDAELLEMNDRLGAELGARTSLEDALRSERARLESVLDTAEDGILSVTSDGVIESANAAAERLFGHPADGLVGTSWARLLADAPPGLALPSPQSTRSGQPIFGLRADGRRFPMELSMGRSGVDAEDARYTVIIRDVSARLTLEEQYRHAQKMEAIGRLTSGIAHDFNNLLMGLMGCAKAVTRRLDEDSPARPYAAELESAAQRGAQLTKDLLSFTRRNGPETGQVDMTALLRDMQGILHRMVGTDIELSVDLPPQSLRAQVGRGPVQQMLLNLVTNARDAIGGEGTISVRCALRHVKEATPLTAFELRPGRYVTLTVEDDGAGMSRETIDRLFEPFFTTKGVGEGTGLGLSMVYSTVERSQGGIDVQSTLGVGSTFRVYLPVAGETGDLEQIEEEEQPAPAPGPRTILVVEDEMLVRQTVVDALEEVGFEVFAARDGQEAKEVWAEHADAIDVVLSDIALPRLTGPALIKDLRLERPDLRYMFMSAYPEESLREDGRIPPEARSLQKPFDPEELYAALDVLLPEG